MIQGRLATEQELDELYGPRKIRIGATFRVQRGEITHYYLQCENHVLHIGDEIINTLHVGYLNTTQEEFIEVVNEEFELKVKENIYRMGLDSFWKKIE